MTMELAFWRFLADPSGVGDASGFASVGYDDRRWREVRVPADFETCHPALDTYEGQGWYRHWVDIPGEKGTQPAEGKERTWSGKTAFSSLTTMSSSARA